MNNITRNKNTSIPALMALILSGFAIYENPASLKNADDAAAHAATIAAAVGVLMAKDANKSGVVAKKPKKARAE